MVFRAFVLGGNPQPRLFRLVRLKSALAASLTPATALGNFVASRPTAARSNDRRTPIADAIGVIGEPCDFDHGLRERRMRRKRRDAFRRGALPRPTPRRDRNRANPDDVRRRPLTTIVRIRSSRPTTNRRWRHDVRFRRLSAPDRGFVDLRSAILKRRSAIYGAPLPFGTRSDALAPRLPRVLSLLALLRGVRDMRRAAISERRTTYEGYRRDLARSIGAEPRNALRRVGRLLAEFS